MKAQGLRQSYRAGEGALSVLMPALLTWHLAPSELQNQTCFLS
jgi:hypothetical protein